MQPPASGQARLARWLLDVDDRITRHEFVIAQDIIAELLGIHRPTVSVALQRLEDEGAIERRGRAIVIVDRPRLERLACECHRVIDLEFDRVLGSRGSAPEALASAATSRSGPMPSETAAALEGMREIAGRLLLVSIREQEAREEAEQANRAKDDFLATVSHQLRTPLTAILGWCTMLQRQNGEAVARGLEVIVQNARTQLKLVEDLLDAARVTSSTLSVELAPTSLTDLVQSAVNTLRPAAEERQVEVRLTMAEEVPPVAADADRLRQVLLNVLTNSLTFTEPGGCVHVDVGSESGHARVSIRDTGQGIAPDLLPHVFERFRQGSGAPGERQGLGLGLSIARAIVELHGGTIGIESPGLNQGTTCWIDLPLQAGHERPAGSVASP
jgi:signal transduction histidine kinase